MTHSSIAGRITVVVSLAVAGSGFVAWHAVASPPAPASTPKYMGGGSCASEMCHGARTPFDEKDRGALGIQRNEWTSWSKNDLKHRDSYRVLKREQRERANQIAKNLGILAEGADAADHPQCAVCHAIDAPAERRGPVFQMDVGVSCEACHGAAEDWTSPHQFKNWPAMRATDPKGMIETQALVPRAERCLSCHQGDGSGESEGKRLFNHELLGAGHPDIPFELERYLEDMKPHWRPENAKAPWFGAKVWAVGQVVALRGQLKQLAAQAGASEGWKDAWPEYSSFDCYDCHHSIAPPANPAAPTWRQARGPVTSGGKKAPGRPRWNASRYPVVRHLLARVAPPLGNSLDAKIRALDDLMTRPASNRTAIEKAAAEAAAILDEASTKFGSGETVLEKAETVALIVAIAGDAEAFVKAGVQASNQAMLSLLSLCATHDSATYAKTPEAVSAALARMKEVTKHPDGFDASTFEKDLKTIRDAMSAAGK